MKHRHFNLIFKPEPGGGFTVVVPSLPGCVTYGENLEAAKTMAKDAITGYLASLKKHGESIPSDDASFFSTIDITTPPSRQSYA
ncbi:MAG: type II toxin-antitoxin system HicB family antitoxin [Candidatus Chisholmbacteria bacterium]|nr:type II toxin-antitoxin system HicB family antitoxin [Candidatus Chisholmbacteria bacterium]